MSHAPKHTVAVIGGAVAGSEIAHRLAAHGCYVAVFEQNPRPYGKVEDGLPRWHQALRAKEFASIDAKLAHKNIDFVPLTRIGEHVDFHALRSTWGFQTIVLACGAWRDRALPLPEAESYKNRGVVYQNDLIYWFNHYPEADYQGPHYSIADGATIIGGGLASIDVAKVCMLETTRTALAQRGITVEVEALERAGMDAFLKTVGLSFSELGIKGCTLFYRRRIEDMPLAEIPDDADESKQERVRQSRRRILEKAQDKYKFNVVPLHAPERLILADERVQGVCFRQMRLQDGQLGPTHTLLEHPSPLVISSIGSVAAPIMGLPMKQELFDFVDRDLGRLAEFPNVYGVGNVVTGRGNIVASRRHAMHVSGHIAAAYLGVNGPKNPDAVTEAASDAALSVAKRIEHAVLQQPDLSAEALALVRAKVAARQTEVNLWGTYSDWIQQQHQKMVF